MPPAPYVFQLDQEKGDLNAQYTFTTSTGLTYSVTFTEVTRIIDVFDNYPVLSNGIYLVIEPTNKPQNTIIGFDCRIGSTICDIYNNYLENTDTHTIIIYNCEEKDGKQDKRHSKFSRWFTTYMDVPAFEKIDKDILLPEDTPDRGTIYISSPLSIIFDKNHPRYLRIFEEVAQVTESINTGKPGTGIL